LLDASRAGPEAVEAALVLLARAAGTRVLRSYRIGKTPGELIELLDRTLPL
jgi:hypothetical protein